MNEEKEGSEILKEDIRASLERGFSAHSPSSLLDLSPDLFWSLKSVLKSAIKRAAYGKGQRHALPGEPFEHQRICRSAFRFGIGGNLQQIVKKAEEIPALRKNETKIDELLDIIVYAAATIIVLGGVERDKEVK